MRAARTCRVLCAANGRVTAADDATAALAERLGDRAFRSALDTAVQALGRRESDERVVEIGGIKITLSLWRTGLADRAAVLVLVTPLELCRACASLRALSPDQRRVASLTSAGLSQDAIAERLGAPLANVRDWLASARKRLGAGSRAELIRAVGRASVCCDPLALADVRAEGGATPAAAS